MKFAYRKLTYPENRGILGGRNSRRLFMLGDLIGEEQGKVTTLRVLDSGGGGPKVEVSFRTNAKILGVAAVNLGTYWSAVQTGGFLYGEGQGIVTTQEGDMVSWKGQGAGKMQPGGGASYRGAIYFQNRSGKLAKLNGTAAVYEHASDASDNITTKYWEWK